MSNDQRVVTRFEDEQAPVETLEPDVFPDSPSLDSRDETAYSFTAVKTSL